MKRILLLAAMLGVVACGRPEASRPPTIAPAAEEAIASVALPEPPEEEAPEGRLGEAVVPTGYHLELQVDPQQESFSGVAVIDVELRENRRVIWLHGQRLEVEAASIVVAANGVPREVPVEYEEVGETGVAQVRLPEVFPAGAAQLRFEYTAPFNRALRGLYRVEEDGVGYAFTQFEATSARLAFPCFDEPAFKTPFEMTMRVKATDTAVFNTPELESTTEGEYKTVRFAPTRPLPTYLVAMAVGQLDVVEHTAIGTSELRDREIPLRGLAVRGKGPELAYALERTGQLLLALEDYFGVPYPYAKLDVVAVPDFAAGAMENAGLITFREVLLLLGDDAPQRQRRAFAYVMAHELAHQWFGNLVTMEWWDDIWLNEAFATWMGNKAVDVVFPEHQSAISLLENVHHAMGVDSLVSARQIRQPIESNHDIRNAFDSITYRKGGGVLSMFETWLGEETFRDGIRAYIREHAWGNATYEDLLRALSEAAGRDIAPSFSSFLFQPGLPMLQVSQACEGESATLTIQQSRYLPEGSTGSRESTWSLPVCVRTDQGQHCEVISEAQGTIALDHCPAWVMPNANGTGYYRFSMDRGALRALRMRGWRSLTAREKMAVADSLGAAFRSNQLSAAQLYPMLEAFAETDLRSVAEEPLGHIAFADDHLLEGSRRGLRRFARQLYAPLWRRLGWSPRSGEDGETALLRASVLRGLAMRARDARLRRDSVRRAHAFLGYGGDGELHSDAVDPNLVSTVLTVAVQDGDEAFFDHLLGRYFESTNALHRGMFLGALSQTKNPELAARLRGLALDERVRVNEMMTPLYYQMSMPEHREATWSWITENYGALASRLEAGAGRLPSLVGFECSEQAAAAAEEYFGTWIQSVPGAPRNLASAVEKARLCGALVAAQRESAQGFFE